MDNLAAASTSAAPSPRRRARLQRSERLHSESSTPYSSWEALIRDSFGQIAWPIKITSWELVTDTECVPTRLVPTFFINFNYSFNSFNYNQFINDKFMPTYYCGLEIYYCVDC